MTNDPLADDWSEPDVEFLEQASRYEEPPSTYTLTGEDGRTYRHADVGSMHEPPVYPNRGGDSLHFDHVHPFID